MNNYSLSKALQGAEWIEAGVVSNVDGSFSKAFEVEPKSSGILEEGFEGPISDNTFLKLSELVGKLPNQFSGQIYVSRAIAPSNEIPGFITKLYFFEQVQKEVSYSHIESILNELNLSPEPISKSGWERLHSSVFGPSATENRIPDLTWERDHINFGDRVVRVLSLTELPQVTWKGCLQPVFENQCEYLISIKISVPDRTRVRKKLETKRRVSHALSVTSSLEVRNIESNSVLSSSEETLERILVGKETLFDISFAIIVAGLDKESLHAAREIERVVSGIGNAGLFLEGVGSLPVLRSHLPGNRTLGIRTLPILSENLSHLLPIFHDYSRVNDPSYLSLRSRSGEQSHLNLFSKENLNFNAFICGSSGAGKSFLMNAILTSIIKDEPNSRLCIFDVGGSYRKIVESNGGKSTALNFEEARALISTFLRLYPASNQGFFKSFIETLCGSGSHITHSHAVAIDDLLQEISGERLEIRKLIKNAAARTERFYLDIAHWLKPHVGFDDLPDRPELIKLIKSPVASFDFKSLDADPVLQKTTILLLTELLWRDLIDGRYTRTIVVFDEVWRFFAQSRDFIEEMYRTLRKYKAGIVSITQNLADYGDESFSKMLFTTSFTKIFLQNGASAEYLRETLDLQQSDIDRALSVTSKKPQYSEFFVLTPSMSQIFRLYPTRQFYELANTEDISTKSRKELK